MRLYLLFSKVKIAALYLVSIKSYAKNAHLPSFFEMGVIVIYHSKQFISEFYYYNIS